MNTQIIKEKWQNLSPHTKKISGVLIGGTLAIAAVCFLAFQFLGGDKGYSTLFTGLNQDEAQEVVGLLQDENIDYRYNTSSGSIQIPDVQVDQIRAELLSKGYPKSGFTYDMYLDNAGLMTTESDKKQYTLYELQDRLGAQIRLFDGVSDAKVTIAEAGEQRYALGDEGEADASASVVVTMEQGATLTADKASAIKNLIARAVRGMNFTNVSVFDAATMLEVDASTPEGQDTFSATKDMTALTSLIENNIAGNVRRVLEQLYGVGNVAVSVKGTLNMEKLIQETTEYTTPEKTGDGDKTGLLYKEDVSSENMGTADETDGGVAGADANADVPRYQYNDEGNTQGDTYGNETASREWLFNSVKEQRQVDPGVLEDTSVGVVILTDDTTTVSTDDLRNLVANSAGIPLNTAQQKITIIRAPGNGSSDQAAQPAGTSAQTGLSLSNPLFIAAVAAGLLILLILILLIMRRRSKKKQMSEFGEFEGGLTPPPLDEPNDGFAQAFEEKEPEEPDDLSANEELINLRMQRNLKLKQSIGEFVDQNPQIAAKLIQSWLRGEESNGRGKDGRGRS